MIFAFCLIIKITVSEVFLRMKEKIRFLNFEFDCQHKELFNFDGLDRLLKINTLSLLSRSLICSFYRTCEACPLFLKGAPGKRSYCSDAASEKELLYSLVLGGHFITVEESENARKDI